MRKVIVAKGKEIPRGMEEKIKKRPGSSNVGKYKDVPTKDFAGASGGSSKYSYPINTEKRAKAALAYAHNAPNPKGIKEAVHRKYPEIGKPNKKSK